jgi:hypothetical protein
MRNIFNNGIGVNEQAPFAVPIVTTTSSLPSKVNTNGNDVSSRFSRSRSGDTVNNNELSSIAAAPSTSSRFSRVSIPVPPNAETAVLNGARMRPSMTSLPSLLAARAAATGIGSSISSNNIHYDLDELELSDDNNNHNSSNMRGPPSKKAPNWRQMDARSNAHIIAAKMDYDEKHNDNNGSTGTAHKPPQWLHTNANSNSNGHGRSNDNNDMNGNGNGVASISRMIRGDAHSVVATFAEKLFRDRQAKLRAERADPLPIPIPSNNNNTINTTNMNGNGINDDSKNGNSSDNKRNGLIARSSLIRERDQNKKALPLSIPTISNTTATTPTTATATAATSTFGTSESGTGSRYVQSVGMTKTDNGDGDGENIGASSSGDLDREFREVDEKDGDLSYLTASPHKKQLNTRTATTAANGVVTAAIAKDKNGSNNAPLRSSSPLYDTSPRYNVNGAPTITPSTSKPELPMPSMLPTGALLVPIHPPSSLACLSYNRMMSLI